MLTVLGSGTGCPRSDGCSSRPRGAAAPPARDRSARRRPLRLGAGEDQPAPLREVARLGENETGAQSLRICNTPTSRSRARPREPVDSSARAAPRATRRRSSTGACRSSPAASSTAATATRQRSTSPPDSSASTASDHPGMSWLSGAAQPLVPATRWPPLRCSVLLRQGGIARAATYSSGQIMYGYTDWPSPTYVPPDDVQCLRRPAPGKCESPRTAGDRRIALRVGTQALESLMRFGSGSLGSF